MNKIPKEKLSKAQRKLIIRVFQENEPITLGLHRIVGPDGVVHMRTFHACLRKGYLVGVFDEEFIPSWYVNPNIPEWMINEFRCEIALGVVK